PFLAAGARNAKEALEAGEARGVLPHTLRRAAKQIGVIVEPVRRDGRVAGWTWRLGDIKWGPQPTKIAGKENPNNNASQTLPSPTGRHQRDEEPRETPKGFNRPLHYRKERF